MTAPRPSDSRGRNGTWRVLAELSVPSEPGNERNAMEAVAGAIRDTGLEGQRLERLKTAVAEATMNAMEHGNHYRPEVPVKIRVLSSEADLSVRITDQGGSPVPEPDKEAPDLEAKLEGLQTPRGWGLFLIKNMVDEMHVTSDETHHTIEVVMHLEGGDRAPGARLSSDRPDGRDKRLCRGSSRRRLLRGREQRPGGHPAQLRGG